YNTHTTTNNLPADEKYYSNGETAHLEHGNLEKGQNEEVVAAGASLHRGLKNRHITMISIGGVIGTGLFLGTANALRDGGPLGMLLGYSIMGTIVWSVMNSLGEMIAYLPIAGGHISLAARIVDPALSFTMGWNYFYNWAIVLPAELSAAAVLVGYWTQNMENPINNGAWIAICFVIVCAINFAGSGTYGEAEFWFASIKILTIIGLIILGIILVAGGGPDHNAIGGQYWQNPGPFVNFMGPPGAWSQFLGFWSVLIQSAFSYIGTEIVAIAAAEAKNPRRSLPRAIKSVYIRILLFYIVGVLIIGLLVPSDDPALNLSGVNAKNKGTAAASPFVIAITRAGIPVLPSIVNACLLTSAWSAASSDVYTASRALYALAVNRQAPRFLLATTKRGLPWICVTISAAFGLLAFMSIGGATSGQVFGWFANMTSVCGLLTWMAIMFTYIRWHKALKRQNFDRSALPFKSPLQPFLGWYGFIMCNIVILFNGWAVFTVGNWDVATFITSYLPVPVFLILLFGFKFIKGTKMLRPEEVDLYTGVDEIAAAETEEPKPKNFFARMWWYLT
ncbi:hypothetical protein BZG36_04603, partial [Bifiguratus adelaidae]